MDIALLEDDLSQAELMHLWLTRAGHACERYQTGRELLDSVTLRSYELAIIDWNLPDMSGDQIIAKLRGVLEWPMPIILSTANDNPADIVKALELGADEFLIKPVRKSEVLARIDALHPRAAQATDTCVFEFAPYRLDASGNVVCYGDKQVSLGPQEFKLALFMFRNANRLLPRTEIVNQVWGADSAPSPTLDAMVLTIRAKLALSPAVGWRLSTIFDHGYRLERLNDELS